MNSSASAQNLLLIKKRVTSNNTYSFRNAFPFMHNIFGILDAKKMPLSYPHPCVVQVFLFAFRWRVLVGYVFNGSLYKKDEANQLNTIHVHKPSKIRIVK